jgi:N-formylglutamate amidohydrolase
MEIYTFHRGRTPLLVDVPHAGTYLPPHLARRLTEHGLALPDTDWHVERLYDFAQARGAGLMAATHSRYVVDLNRDPSGAALYPGRDNTELCPTMTFAGEAIYRHGQEPDAAEVRHRSEHYWLPYHQRLREELDNLVANWGYAVLLDAHSIRSEVPRFFSGRLPDLNLGTADGASADARLAERVAGLLADAPGLTHVVNGRFKGGYITRHYGKPEEAVHALQLEVAQVCYMDEAEPEGWQPSHASDLVGVLEQLVGLLLDWRP